jgi:hypothetical protein
MMRSFIAYYRVRLIARDKWPRSRRRRFAEEQVVAGPADHAVAPELVVAVLAVKIIVASLALKTVVPVAAEDAITKSGAGELVITGRVDTQNHERFLTLFDHGGSLPRRP